MINKNCGVEYINCNFCEKDFYRIIYKLNDFNIVKCRNCGLMYTNPRPTREALFNLYKNGYYKNEKFYDKSGQFIFGYENYLDDKEDIQVSFKKIFKTMDEFIKPGRLLEIGCAMGFFLEIAKQKGWETHGFEISRMACEHAKKIAGPNVYNREFEGREFPPEHFNAVALFDVIEHLQNPYNELQKYSRALKQDGLLVLSTVNADSPVARILGKRWEDIRRTKEHLYIFSKKTINAMLDKTGFQVLRITQYGRHFTLDSISQRLSVYGRKRSKVAKLMFKALNISHWKFHIVPFTKIVIYAKKIK